MIFYLYISLFKFLYYTYQVFTIVSLSYNCFANIILSCKILAVVRLPEVKFLYIYCYQ